MWCVWLSSVARSCATRDASNKDNVWKPTIPAGINRPLLSETISHVTRVPNHKTQRLPQAKAILGLRSLDDLRLIYNIQPSLKCIGAYPLHLDVHPTLRRTPTCTAAYTLHCGLPSSCTAMRFTSCCTAAYPLLHCGVPSHLRTAAHPPLALRCDLPRPLALRNVFFCPSAGGTPQCPFYLFLVFPTPSSAG